LPVHKLKTTQTSQPRAVVIAVTHSVNQRVIPFAKHFGPLFLAAPAAGRIPFPPFDCRKQRRRLSSCRLVPVKLAAACNYGLNAMRTPLDRRGSEKSLTTTRPPHFPLILRENLYHSALERRGRRGSNKSNNFRAILYSQANCCC